MSGRDADGISRNGLRVDRAKQLAWQRRGAEAYAARQRARRSAARLTTRIDRAKPANRNDWPAAVRNLARRRSGGVCELCLEHPAEHLHHRKSRRHHDHRIVNALHLCHRCHDRIHTSRSRTAAYDAGHLVRALDDPAAIAVVLPVGRVLLTDDGDYLEEAA